ncbi:MAG: hypothetical protein ACK4HQ_03665 [Brevinematales bacterium]
MKQLTLIITILGIVVSCSRTTRGESIPSLDTGKESTKQQSEIFEAKLADTTLGEVERSYLQFRLFLNGKFSFISLHPTLSFAFSNEFVNNLWDSSAYRSAYLSYITLTNIFTNNIDKGFLLGRAGIAAFKARQYSIAIQMLQQAFAYHITDETVYYYGLWYWYIKKDKTKAREILSRLRPERLGINPQQWKSFLSESTSVPQDDFSLLKSSDTTNQANGFLLWLEKYEKTGEPFWKYEAPLPPYIPPSGSIGYYLTAQDPQFPRMTRDWPMPFSIRQGKPGQNRYALFLEEPLEEDNFLFLYAQPVDFPWQSGYRGISSIFPRTAYTNAFFVYATAFRETNGKITNIGIQTIPIPTRYFLSCKRIYRNENWHYVIVGFQNPDKLNIIVFDPFSRELSHIEASLREIQKIYYIRHPLSNQWKWIGIGKSLHLLEEKPLSP